MTNPRVGHNVLGISAVALGVITLGWHQIDALGSISHPDILIYVVSIVEIIGGLSVQRQKTAKLGALTLGVVFSIFTLYWIPSIFKTPLVFAYWGNFFEQFSIVLGTVFVLASTIQDNPDRSATIARAAYIGFGVCVITYSLYQLFYLAYTAKLVPTWIPPGQMFWAIATSVFFALAAIAILSGRLALLASRLLTLMLVLFGFLVWIPPAFADPHTLSNWREFVENALMTGTSWIVAEFLSQTNLIPRRWPFPHGTVNRTNE